MPSIACPIQIQHDTATLPPSRASSRLSSALKADAAAAHDALGAMAATHNAKMAVLRGERNAAVDAEETNKAALQQGGLVGLRLPNRGVPLPTQDRHLGLLRRRHCAQRVLGGRRVSLQGRYVFVCVRGRKGCMG